MRKIFVISVFIITLLSSCYKTDMFSENNPVIVNPSLSLPFGTDSILLKDFIETADLTPTSDTIDTINYFYLDNEVFKTPPNTTYVFYENFNTDNFLLPNEELTLLMVRLNFYNYIPTAIELTVSFIDQRGTTKLQLPEDYSLVIPPLNISNETPGTLLKADFALDSDDIARIQEVRFIRFKATANIQDPENSSITFNSGSPFIIQLGMRMELKNVYNK